ncbi:UNVERIFIED_CONTAM: hypothetical protein Slati_1459000 [Sesamum latifolium]|uniref:Reverse transcriptase domain-containing protein n=1 Tax=Sesamum latifolium TaxID=2727402 RepID=A0AAW2X7W4_9LAMI
MPVEGRRSTSTSCQRLGDNDVATQSWVGNGHRCLQIWVSSLDLGGELPGRGSTKQEEAGRWRQTCRLGEDVDAQYVHFLVLIRCIHTHVLMTIVYGVNDLGGRRGDGSHGTIVAAILGASGKSWTISWLMIVGWAPGRTHFMLASMPVLQTTLLLCCVGTFRSKLLATKLEEHMLQQWAKLAWTKGGDQCSRIFFRKVAKRRTSKSIFQITNTTGQILTDQQDVINEFIAFYQALLGGERRFRLIDLCYLRPWARHIINEDEAIQLTRRVTPMRSSRQSLISMRIKHRGQMDTHRDSLKQLGRLLGRRGARGLRQGDPMSPYLFVLVMEVLNLILQQIIEQDGGFTYHWRCEALHLFQLGFADDLLLFSRADVDSVHTFNRGFTIFADLSGLYVNPQKSHLILSQSASDVWDTLLTLLHFREGFLPLSSSNQCWLHSRFIGLWHLFCLRRSYGKLRSDFARFFGRVPMEGNMQKFHGTSDRTGSWGWRKLIRLREILQQFIEYKIGSGASFSLWHNPWHELGPLILRFPMGPHHTDTLPTAFLNTVIMERAWCWPPITNMESVEITHSLPIVYGGEDQIVWTAPRDTFSPASAYAIFRLPGPTVGWSSLLLGTFKIPQHCFILWLAILGKLSTLDKPWLRHMGFDCVLCSSATPESHDHLFFRCQFASTCICEIRRMVRFEWPYTSWEASVLCASKRWRGKHVVNAANRALLASLVYHLWQERNYQIFRAATRYPRDIATIIVSEVRELIISKELPQTVSTLGLYRLWRIPWPVEGDATL